jgi:hypothetical protein
MKAWLVHCVCKSSTSAREEGEATNLSSPSTEIDGKNKVEENIENTTNKNNISIKNPTTRKLRVQ